jgi:hypothetical protein
MRSLPIYAKRDLAPHPADLLTDTRSRDGEQRYCTYPFRLFGIASDIMKPCTWLRQIPGTSVLSVSECGGDLLDVWRSEVFDNVRRSIAEGEYHFCNLEYCPEYQGEQKYFLTLEELKAQYPAIADYVSGVTDAYLGGPELVNVAYDTGCNLSCPSCNRHTLPKLPRAQVAGFATTLDQLADDVLYIYLAGMGDPFGTPHYFDWLRTVDVSRYKKLREIMLNTNGLLWTPQTWAQVPAATRARVRTAIISIDGASAATYDVNRWPAKWDDLLENLRFIASLRRRDELKMLRAYFVYQANNFHEMPAMVQFCRDNAFDAVFFARIANWKSAPQAEYDELDVVNPNHPAHQDYLRVAGETAALGDDRLQVVVMR